MTEEQESGVRSPESGEKTIPAFSFWQPWASAMLPLPDGSPPLKTIETRSWPPPDWALGKPLLIHAAKRRMSREEADFLAELQSYRHLARLLGCKDEKADYGGDGYSRFLRDGLPLGCLLGIGTLIAWSRFDETTERSAALHYGGQRHELASMEMVLGDFSPGRYGWVLANVRALPTPIPYRGAQGLFPVPLSILPEAYRPEPSS